MATAPKLLAKFYRDVPAADLEAFQRFRNENPLRTAEIGGRTWSYLSGGAGGTGDRMRI